MSPQPDPSVTAQGGSLPVIDPQVVAILRAHQSAYFLWSAQHHARLARTIEEKPQGDRFSVRHRAYVNTVIIDSAVFLESTINEFFGDLSDLPNSALPRDLSQRTVDRMHGYWQASKYDRPVLDKYDDSLRLAEREPIGSGGEPGQSARLLIQLRNHLMHYKPFSVGEEIDPKNLVLRLRERRFPDNELMAGSAYEWFPFKALGAGCAEWAHTTALKYADIWSARMGVTCTYTNFRGDEEP